MLRVLIIVRLLLPLVLLLPSQCQFSKKEIELDERDTESLHAWVAWFHKNQKYDENLEINLLADIHDPLNAFRGIRSTAASILTMEGYLSALEEAKFPYCTLTRDLWSCQGDHYIEVLKNTSLYNKAYTLSSLPNGSSLYIEGNSFMAEKICAIICNTENIKVYKIDSTLSNSYIVESLDNNSTLLFASNDGPLFSQYNSTHLPAHIVHILRSHMPELLVIGHNNNGPNETTQFVKYHELFDGEATVHLYTKKNLPHYCYAQWTNCDVNFSAFDQLIGGHSCFPGPLYRNSEIFFKEELLEPLEKIYKNKNKNKIIK